MNARLVVSVWSSSKWWFVLLLSASELVCHGALKTWVGTGGTGNWSTAANWSPAGAPANGDDLSFPSGAPQLIVTNNLSRSFNSINFSGAGGGYILRGNGVTLSNGITAAHTLGVNILQLAITNGADQTVTATTGGTLNLDGPIALGSFTLTINNTSAVDIGGLISGAGNLTKNGNGVVTLDGAEANTFTGVTTVNQGTLELNDVAAESVNMIVGEVRITTGGTLLLTEGNQISDSSAVSIAGFGVFDLNNRSEQIGSLVMNGGDVVTGVGVLTNGNITTIASSSSATINGNLHLGNSTRTFDIANGSAGSDLVIAANIAGGSSGVFPFISYAGIIKEGTGRLDLSGTNNTYFGHTTINEGSIRVLEPSALGAWFTLIGGTSPGTTVNEGGQLTLVGLDVVAEPLTCNSTGTFLTASGSSSWGGPVTLNAHGTVTTGGTLTFSNVLNGAGGITFSGGAAGAVYRYQGTNANGYTGTTIVDTGTLELNVNEVNGAIRGPLIIGNGTGSDGVRLLRINQITNNATVTVNSNAFLDLGGFSDAIGNLEMTAGLVTNGLLTLTGTNVIVNASGVSSVIGSRLWMFASEVNFNVANGDVFSDLLITNTIDGNALTKSGTGIMTLSVSNNYSGVTTVADGILRAENDFSLGRTSAGTTVQPGGELRFPTGVTTVTEPLTLGGTMGLYGSGTIASNIVMTGANAIYVDVGNWDITNVISGTGPMVKTGFGELRLSGNSGNTFTGGVTVQNGELMLNKSTGDAISGPVVIGDGASSGTDDVLGLMQPHQIPDNASVTLHPTGVLSMPADDEQIGALSGSGSIDLGGAGDLTFGDAASTVFSGTISGVGGQVAKVGSGTVTFTGDSSYGNGLNISQVSSGTLLITGSTTNVPWLVSSSGSFGGTGTVANLRVLGNLRPGVSPGIVTVSNLTFTSSGDYFVELNGPVAGIQYDRTEVRGSVVLDGATLHVLPNFSVPVLVGTRFTIIDNNGAEAVTNTFAGLPDGATFEAGGNTFSIDYNGGNGNNVTLTLVSGPAAAVNASVSGGNGNHAIEPGECNLLHLVVSNRTGVAMTGVKATLASSTAFVGIAQAYSQYPNIPSGASRTNISAFQVTTISNLQCGSIIDLNLLVTTESHGSFAVPVQLLAGAPAPLAERFDVDALASIPDTGTIESTNTVSGFSGPVSKVTVSMWVTHIPVSDLSISLISPEGTEVDLTSGNGAGANFGTACSPDEARTTFDDAAAVSITAGAAPFVGTFRPEGSLGSIFSDGNGDWRLRITDSYGGSLGTLRCWSLSLHGTTCAPGGGACDYCVAQITGALEASDLQLTNRLFRDGEPVNCGQEAPFPGTAGAGSVFYYDAHVFTNTSSEAACVTVQVEAECTVHSSLYLDTFDPSDLASNYLADSGSSTVAGAAKVFSGSVPAGARFVVVLNTTASAETCGSYTLKVGGLPCPQPQLAINPSGTSQARIHWPTWAGDYRLEANLNLSTTNWSAVTNEPLVDGSRLNVTNSSVSPTNRFYRLTKP